MRIGSLSWHYQIIKKRLSKLATYQYKCTNKECEVHDLTWEVVQSMKDDALTTCPECGKETLTKVISSGGGFRIGGLGVHKPTAHWGG